MVKKKEAKEWARDKVKGQFFGNITPFTAGGEAIDEEGLRKNLRHCIALGADGIGWGGPLSEPFTMTIKERKRGHEILAEEAKRGGVVSYAYPSSESLPQTIELAQHAAAVGCDLLMVNVPFEWTKTDAMIFSYFELIAEKAGEIGILLYNTPHSSYILPLDMEDKIANLPSVCCLKEATGRTFDQTAVILEQLGDRIVVCGGNPTEWPTWAEAGFNWTMPHPESYMCQTLEWQPLNEMYDLSKNRKFDEARQIQQRIEPLAQTRRKMFEPFGSRGPRGRSIGRSEHPNAGIKYWLDLIGMVGGPVRPLTSPFPDEDKEWLARDLEGHVAAGTLKLQNLFLPVSA